MIPVALRSSAILLGWVAAVVLPVLVASWLERRGRVEVPPNAELVAWANGLHDVDPADGPFASEWEVGR